MDALKLNYELKTPQERIELVNKIIESSSPEKLTSKYLDELSKYIVFCMDDAEKKSKKILTPNRENYIKMRETSLEGMAVKFETSDGTNNIEGKLEDTIYNLAINDKNVYLTPRKTPVTQEELDTIPGLQEIQNEIERLEEQFKIATGKARFSIKNNIKELWKDFHELRKNYKKPISYSKLTKVIKRLDLYETIKVENQEIIVEDSNISLLIPQHISFLLCNYSTLKEECYGCFDSDIYYMMIALDELVERALDEKYPMYKDILIHKIDGLQNADIQRELEQKYNNRYSIEYISSLWRQKIPKIIAEQARKEYTLWYFTEVEKGHYKKCSKCGQIKLAHPYFYSKNKSSKDGYYSICKECRNKKKG